VLRNKRREEPYISDVYKYSIYPRVNYKNSDEEIKVGQQLIVDIYDVDNKGCGIVFYKGRKIIIPNAMLGAKVKIKIVRIEKDFAVASVLDVLRETDNAY
jgi:predicted RNA-binding protein with TRAM domain